MSNQNNKKSAGIQQPVEAETTPQQQPEDEDRTPEILKMVDFIAPVESDLPMVGFSDVTEDSQDGSFTSLGFAKICPGWSCVGYVIGAVNVESEFDSAAGRKKQSVFQIRGTVRAKLANADGFGDVKGMIKLPQYARLRESVAEVLKAERRENKKICVKITYMGQNTPTMKDDGVTVKRAGSHIWEVRRVNVIRKAD